MANCENCGAPLNPNMVRYVKCGSVIDRPVYQTPATPPTAPPPAPAGTPPTTQAPPETQELRLPDRHFRPAYSYAGHSIGLRLDPEQPLNASYHAARTAGVKSLVKTDFEQYGIELVDMLIEAVTVPPDVQTAINKAAGIAAQDVDKYGKIAAADAMLEASKNPGVAAGLGIGMGFGMAGKMAEQFSATAPQSQASKPTPTPEEVEHKLKALKQMKDEDLLTDADYEDMKRKILAQL